MKALVENAIGISYKRIFAPLRNRTFYCLKELNAAIWQLLEKHNNTPFQRMNTTRYELFLEVEKDKLKPLPLTRYEFKKFSILKVAFNYHVYLSEDAHYYSVPYRFAAKKVKLAYSNSIVEIYHDNIRIAFHVRDRRPGGYTTNRDHMPVHHKYYLDWSPQRIGSWAAKVGPNVKDLTSSILDEQKYPEQGYRICLGIINLAKKYGNLRVNNACFKAIGYRLYSYKAVKNMLDEGLESTDEEKVSQQMLPIHENIRGAIYYN